MNFASSNFLICYFNLLVPLVLPGMMLFAKTAIVVLGDLADTLGSNTGPLIQQKAETILTQTDFVHKEFMPLQEEVQILFWRRIRN